MNVETFARASHQYVLNCNNESGRWEDLSNEQQIEYLNEARFWLDQPRSEWPNWVRNIFNGEN